METVEYRSLIEKHQYLTSRLFKLDEWISELNSGVIIDFELKLRQFAREIGDVKRTDRFQLGNSIVDESVFINRAWADHTQTLSDLTRLETEMRGVNPIVVQYGQGAFNYLENFFPGYGLLSYVVTIPFYPITRQWRYFHQKPISVLTEISMVSDGGIPYTVDLDRFMWREFGINFLAGYINEVNILCEYDLNRREHENKS